jgi:hypothetical protein
MNCLKISTFTVILAGLDNVLTKKPLNRNDIILHLQDKCRYFTRILDLSFTVRVLIILPLHYFSFLGNANFLLYIIIDFRNLASHVSCSTYFIMVLHPRHEIQDLL